MRKLVSTLACPVCKKVVQDERTIVESKSMPGVFLTGCKCGAALMTAGDQLIEIPNDSSERVLALKEELSYGLIEEIADKIDEADMPEGAKMFLGAITGMLKSALDETMEEVKQEAKNNNSLSGIKIIGIDPSKLKEEKKEVKHPFHPSAHDFNHLISRPNSVTMHDMVNRIDPKNQITAIKVTEDDIKNMFGKATPHITISTNATKYVVLSDGDVYDEYDATVSIKEIFEDMIADHGAEAVAEGKVTLHELKEIKPNFKRKTSFELDM